MDLSEPLVSLTLAAAAEAVLGDVGPLTATELVVNLKERGYRPDDDPRVMLTLLRDAFKRKRACVQPGRGWAVDSLIVTAVSLTRDWPTCRWRDHHIDYCPSRADNR